MRFVPDNINRGWRKLIGEKHTAADAVIKVFILVLLVTVISLLFPHPEEFEYSYTTGAVWADKDLIAPFSFPIYKDLHDYEGERQEAVKNVYPVFTRNIGSEQNLPRSLGAIFDTLRRALGAYEQMMKARTAVDSAAFQQIALQLDAPLSDQEWAMLFQLHLSDIRKHTHNLDKIRSAITSALAEVLHTGVIDQIKLKQTHAQFALRKGTLEDILPYEKVYDVDEAASQIAARLTASLGESPDEAIAYKLARSILKPNIQFDADATNLAVQIAEDNVPRTIGYVQENERIVSKHDRITDEIRLKLDSFRKAKAERGSNFNVWKHWVGIILHVTLVVGFFALYLYLFRKKIFTDNGKLTLISLLLIMETSFAYLSIATNLTEPVQFLIFVPAASMLLAIIFDSRVAIYGTMTIAFLIAGIRGNDYAIALTSLIAGSLGAYTVRDIRNRTQIFRSLIFIFLGYACSICAMSLEQFESLSTIVTQTTFALANAVFSPVLTYGMLIFFERVFKVTTDLTLLELSDFNQPLLRDLSEKAPGTFHHSITIGNLAEAAAEAIGANSILARVGGYYHDIGKMLKPEYFVENQIGIQNRHVRLKPRMSALIIGSHVKEGIELGRERGLPQKVLDFIPQHHGTTRMSYFYDKALKQAAKRPTKEAIQEEDFRYPGPKPQTKETGIVMLADSVEASTRSLSDVTPQKLETVIENMIRHRFIDGQLDECELTLRDLTKIKEAFLKILVGIHHQRIKYPEQQQLETPTAEATPSVSATSAEEGHPASESEPQMPLESPVTAASEPRNGISQDESPLNEDQTSPNQGGQKEPHARPLPDQSQ